MLKRVMIPKIIILICLSCTVKTDINRITHFLNKDLRTLNQKKINFIYKLAGRKPDPDFLSFRPWYVWKTQHNKKMRYIIFEGRPCVVIPGASFAAIHLYDENGSKIDSWTFSTGWRIDLVNAKYSKSDELDIMLITINSQYCRNGRDVAKQYYAFSGDKLRFIRMEDSNGNLLYNRYEYPNHTIGVEIEDKSESNWFGLLKSQNIADKLAALLFLGGSHRDLNEQIDPAIDQEQISQVNLILKLRENNEIKELIKKYSKSNNKWLSEATVMALSKMK